jgi:hypothetical protein
MDMLTSITGVDSKGLADHESELTATAVLYTSQVFATNIKHFYTHLRTSFKALGDLVMIMLGYAGKKIDVAQGPDAYMQNQIARQELTALMGVVEPNQKRAIVNAILRTHPDNEILATLYAELNSVPQPSAMEQEMEQVIEQMKQAIEQKDQEIMNLTAQVEDFRRSDRSQDKSHVFELEKMRLQHEYDQEDKILEAQIEQGLDADRAAAENERERIKVEADATRAAIRAEGDLMKLQGQAAKQEMELDKEKASMALDLTKKIFGGDA